jgi:hypothetical protein
VTSEIIAALIGAAIALVGGIAGAFLQHFLSLRMDRIMRERDARKEETRGLKRSTMKMDCGGPRGHGRRWRTG